MLKNLKIIAIGGGEIGRPGYPVETTAIDKKIIQLSNKKRPKLLFIPTASRDAELYVETVKKHFGKRLGCIVDVLYLVAQKPARKHIAQKILNADIIYVGGGNTLFMMNLWQKYGVDKLLVKAANQGRIMAGLSAGSICWFKSGLSDSRQCKNADAKFIQVSGLNLINALHCPHYDVEPKRKSALKKLMKKVSGIAIALGNCCALEVVSNSYRIVKSKKVSRAYKCFWQYNKYHKIPLNQSRQFQPLPNLLKR